MPMLTAAERSAAARPPASSSGGDPLRKPCRLVQRALNVVPHLFEARLRRRRIGVCQPCAS